MKISRNRLLSVLSYSLDCVEKEVLGVKMGHAKRVAGLCKAAGTEAGLDRMAISDVLMCSLMHDNALNEFKDDYVVEAGKITYKNRKNAHCIAGENNINSLLISGDSENAVLYHHECANGSGPFGKIAAETPLTAQLIHCADEIDLKFPLNQCITSGFIENIRRYIKENREQLFSEEVCGLFLNVINEDLLIKLHDINIDVYLFEDNTDVVLDIKDSRLRDIVTLFAHIVDAKSPFTKEHSIGISRKAEEMGRFYGFDEETVMKLYFAGALHDIGKLSIHNEVLEKAGRLTNDEYAYMQSHAYETYKILKDIPDFEDITSWASLHHEKLDGSGYPFGKRADELDFNARLMACLDIYQALTEDRPYKAGMSHNKAIGILCEMAHNGQLDKTIVGDLDAVFGSNGETDNSSSLTAVFQCKVCGYIHEAAEIPYEFLCPVCGNGASAFERIL